MGKNKKTSSSATKGGAGSPKTPQTSPASKSGGGDGGGKVAGTSSPVSEDTPPKAGIDKQVKKRQPAKGSNAAEPAKNKPRTDGGRDSSEDTKRQDNRKKRKGAQEKPKTGGSCFISIVVVFVVVLVAAVVGIYVYPDDRVLGTLNVKATELYKNVHEFVLEKLNLVLNNSGKVEDENQVKSEPEDTSAGGPTEEEHEMEHRTSEENEVDDQIRDENEMDGQTTDEDDADGQADDQNETEGEVKDDVEAGHQREDEVEVEDQRSSDEDDGGKESEEIAIDDTEVLDQEETEALKDDEKEEVTDQEVAHQTEENVMAAAEDTEVNTEGSDEEKVADETFEADETLEAEEEDGGLDSEPETEEKHWEMAEAEKEEVETSVEEASSVGISAEGEVQKSVEGVDKVIVEEQQVIPEEEMSPQTVPGQEVQSEELADQGVPEQETTSAPATHEKDFSEQIMQEERIPESEDPVVVVTEEPLIAESRVAFKDVEMDQVPGSEGLPEIKADEEFIEIESSEIPEADEFKHHPDDFEHVIEVEMVETADEAKLEVENQEDADPVQHEDEVMEPATVAEAETPVNKETSHDENQIERELDDIEKLENESPRDAVELYGRFLSVDPQNARAVIGKARAIGILADAEQNDATLEQSISEYLKIFALPSVPKSLMVAAARACAERQTMRGWGNSAAQTLQSLVSIYPDDLELRNELGQKYLMNGAYEDARAAFKEILQRDPNDAYAMLYLGYIMKLVDRDLGQSLDYMKNGLTTVPITDLKFYMELGEALTRAGRHNEAHKVYQLAVDRKLLKSTWQRSWNNVDGVRDQPWWTVETTKNTDYLQVLENFHKEIRDEALNILANKSLLFVSESSEVIEKGEWKHLRLFVNGRKMLENCEAAAKTCSLLEAFTDATNCKQCEVKFTLMHPGLHLFPHTGPTNCRLTGHLGLVADTQNRIRVGDETRTWIPGRFLIFDDSFEQELWIINDSFQLVLVVEMWHPDLSVERKSTLGSL